MEKNYDAIESTNAYFIVLRYITVDSLKAKRTKTDLAQNDESINVTNGYKHTKKYILNDIITILKKKHTSSVQKNRGETIKEQELSLPSDSDHIMEYFYRRMSAAARELCSNTYDALPILTRELHFFLVDYYVRIQYTVVLKSTLRNRHLNLQGDEVFEILLRYQYII